MCSSKARPPGEDSGQQASEQRVATAELIARSFPGIVWLHEHPSGTVQLANPQAVELLGRAAGACERYQTVREWLVPEDRRTLDAVVEQLACVEPGESTETQLRLPGRTGETLHFRGVHTLLERGPDGSVARSLTVLHDITERYLLFASLERKALELESILHSTPDAFIRLDGERRVRQCFPGRFWAGRWDPSRAVGRTLSEVLPADVLPWAAQVLDEAERERRIIAREQLLPDAPDHSFEVRALPLLRGEQMLVLRGLEERARTERTALEHRSRSIQAAKMASLGLMAAGVAHEINTPLAVISLNAQLIEEQARAAAGVDRAVLLDEAEAIRGTAGRISQIIKSLKAFARDEAAADLRPVSARALVADALALCSARFASHGVGLEVAAIADTLEVLARPSEVSQILVNLLANAFDAVQGRSERWVRLEVAEHADRVSFAVVDSGAGVPPLVRGKLFSLFFSTKLGTGTGLGLGISRRLAEGQGGSLDLDERATHTCFVLTLGKPAPARAVGT